MELIQMDEEVRKDVGLLKKEDKQLLIKLMDLLMDILQNPYQGIGHPEPLKGNLSGYWSRQINKKHRVIYQVDEDVVIVQGCYGHYGGR